MRRLYLLSLLFLCGSRRRQNRRTLAADISWTGFQNWTKFGRLIEDAVLYVNIQIAEWTGLMQTAAR